MVLFDGQLPCSLESGACPSWIAQLQLYLAQEDLDDHPIWTPGQGGLQMVPRLRILAPVEEGLAETEPGEFILRIPGHQGPRPI